MSFVMYYLNKYVYFNTKLVVLSDLELEKLIICPYFKITGIKPKMANGGFGSYQKFQAKYITYNCKEFGAFVMCTHV